MALLYLYLLCEKVGEIVQGNWPGVICPEGGTLKINVGLRIDCQ